MTSRTARRSERVGAEPPRALFKLVNPVMRWLLQTPAHKMVSARLMLLTVTGRMSGKKYTIPVGYDRVGDILYAGTNGRWAKNLRGGAPVEVLFQGVRHRARADLITDVDGLERAYREIHDAAPGYASALARSTGITFGPGGEVQRDAVVRAQAAGNVVIRTTLTGAG